VGLLYSVDVDLVQCHVCRSLQALVDVLKKYLTGPGSSVVHYLIDDAERQVHVRSTFASDVSLGRLRFGPVSDLSSQECTGSRRTHGVITRSQALCAAFLVMAHADVCVCTRGHGMCIMVRTLAKHYDTPLHASQLIRHEPFNNQPNVAIPISPRFVEESHVILSALVERLIDPRSFCLDSLNANLLEYFTNAQVHEICAFLFDTLRNVGEASLTDIGDRLCERKPFAERNRDHFCSNGLSKIRWFHDLLQYPVAQHFPDAVHEPVYLHVRENIVFLKNALKRPRSIGA